MPLTWIEKMESWLKWNDLQLDTTIYGGALHCSCKSKGEINLWQTQQAAFLQETLVLGSGPSFVALQLFSPREPGKQLYHTLKKSGYNQGKPMHATECDKMQIVFYLNANKHTI